MFCSCFDIQNNLCTQTELVFFMYRAGKSMNNVLSYCGLVDPRISASDKVLPIPFSLKDLKQLPILHDQTLFGAYNHGE